MTYPDFYQPYVDRISDGSVIDNLMDSGDKFSISIQSISEDMGKYRYAADKWTIKEVLQHINDAERVFCYRSLCFVRGDRSELPGFDQNTYVRESRANDRKLAALLNEFHIIRASSIDLFTQLTSKQYKCTGIANGGEFTVEAIGLIISGHCLHHLKIIREKYLNGN